MGPRTTPDGRSLFPDEDLVGFVDVMYGPVMAVKCEDIFNDDPENDNGFAQSVRRSLTRELDKALKNGWKGE